jgi:cytochrome b subunit of formate dehydrogenase
MFDRCLLYAMRRPFRPIRTALLLLLTLVTASVLTGHALAQTAAAAPAKIPSETCLLCHGNPDFAVKAADGTTRSLYVDKDKFSHSVHGARDCVDCHTNITSAPHEPVQVQVSCVNCHEALWKQAQDQGKTKENATLGLVADRVSKFMASVHAQPSKADQSRTNATCYNCHEPHYVYPPGTEIWQTWRLNLPNTCGKCHGPELAAYATSIHGVLVLQGKLPVAATCADCHTSHEIANPALTSTRLVITRNCGSCHSEQLRTYLATYHGQVNTLGYAYTAKCFDCHGAHTIQLVNDPRASVYPANRLATCMKCHSAVSAGFLTFEPHGNAHDPEHYPYLWATAKFMTLLLIVVFGFFWTHSALWFYRSWKERRQRAAEGDLYYNPEQFDASARHHAPHIQRFAGIWRAAHLVFLLSTMTLVLTGMAVLYSDSFWAPVVARAFGGPQIMAIVHHTAAAIFLLVFAVHILWLALRFARDRRPFAWFGPDSLVVRWQDLYDILAMFRWFFGVGSRPQFDRWTYWEKFDYWAVFWGVAVIGGSGATLYFRYGVAKVLPGWVLNVATILHGEEALLAAVFLFTVHFFNNHFRPDKFPLDTVMFTGAYTLEEFKREHTVQYERLVEAGQLDRYQVPPPSASMAMGARILGFMLIGVGLVLLFLVAIGFLGHSG